ncbi:hypothetical protein RGQ29_030353 [Quercus rubra]|uniref:PWWP domain-containing protein n=1 Tax=Quercus rubra TaxID=3512 RepID=A0AAN7EHC2_QUERU|nr:hypothetical protein RGQ29_030353 [Quercus rubra]KAK4571917.1 hypothetical protein RGQ29_030353 [Quercus rubra]
MKNKNLTNGEIGKKGVEEIATNKVTLGDLIWVKHDGGSWWPAQIIDENRGSIKPGDKSAGKVRVRLYGSNEYLYVDPVKCHSKFELELKQNNGSYRKILEKSLEKDLPHSKSSRSKRQGAKSKDDETPEKERIQKRPKQSSKSAENGNNFIWKVSRAQCPKTESHAKSWSDCSFWVTVPQNGHTYLSL